MLAPNLAEAFVLTGELLVLLEATMRRISRKAALMPIEHELELALEEAFFRQGEAYIAKFKKLKPWFPPEELREVWIPTNLSPAELDALWAMIMAGTWTYFEEPMSTAAVKAMLAGKASIVAELNWVGSFELGFDEALLNQIPALTKMQLHSINRTTQKYINTQIRHAMEEGWSYNRTAKAITARFEEFAIGKPQLHIRSRAHLVAVTETGNLYEEAGMQTASAIQGMGLEVEKYWANVGDDRVSDGCLANTAQQWIPLNQPFLSGHMKPLRFPGCRCNAHYRRKR